MREEGKITMSEFKTVVESFRSDLKKFGEVMNHGFEKARKERNGMKEQIGLLLEGQTEIRAALKEKASVQICGDWTSGSPDWKRKPPEERAKAARHNSTLRILRKRRTHPGSQITR